VHTARDKYTLELVEAEDLWIISTIDQSRYICRGCEVGVFPASYIKEVNKRRPYFTLGPVNQHSNGCDVDGEVKLINSAKRRSVGSADGFPLPFPNRLAMNDERSVIPTEAPLRDGREGSGRKSRGTDSGISRKHHGHTVKTIRPACRTYINFPFDRAILPFSIPGVYGTTYAEIFWYLGSKRPSHFKNPKHLYYAAIRWTVDPVLTDASCVLTLNVGNWNQETKKHESLSRIHVNWSTWSQSRRDTLMREFEVTREEAAEKAKKNSRQKGWVFFVGEQDSVDPEIFHVNNHNLICCLPGEMIWPHA